MKSQSRFICAPGRIHLNTAARGLVPRDAQDACRDYFRARAGLAEGAPDLNGATRQCKASVGALMGVAGEDIAFIGSASDGINAVYAMIEWRAGDNVVVVVDALEFPSVLIPARGLRPRGVDVRTVAHENWQVPPQRIADAVDARTRVVFVSHVSYRTGHRFDLEALAAAVRARGDACFAVDVSQSLGVTRVPAGCCDFAVSTAFKWTLGAHGVAVLYWNRTRIPDPRPAGIGWHSVVSDEHEPYELKPDAARFEAGSPAYLPIFALQAGVRAIESEGLTTVAENALELGARLMHGLSALGLSCITPPQSTQRAGIVCWEDPHCARTARRLAEQGIIVSGSVGRVRASMHLYNDASDVDALLQALGTREMG